MNRDSIGRWKKYEAQTNQLQQLLKEFGISFS
jgi:hypothetical protein